MKQSIRDEINKLYSLFKTTPKLNVKNTQQHIQLKAFSKTQINPLRKAVNEVIGSGKCAWCGSSKKKVQESFRDEKSKEEYQLSALCQPCQDEAFKDLN